VRTTENRRRGRRVCSGRYGLFVMFLIAAWHKLLTTHFPSSVVRRPSSAFCLLPSAFCLLVFSLGLSGCAARQPLPSSLAAPVPQPDAQQFLTTFETRRQSLQSLRGLARVVYKDPTDSGTAKQAVAVAAPDHFRLELFSPVGIALLATCDGQTLAAYAPQEKIIYRGDATPLNTARFTRVMLSNREIVSLLLGLPALSLDQGNGTGHLDPDTGWYRYTVALSDGGRHVLWFEPQSRMVRQWERRDTNDAVLVRMHLAEYRAVNNYLFPFEIVLVDGAGKQEVSIFYERVEVNPPLPVSLFTLAPIKGVQESDLDALASP
jgi:outer membrane lipoprotein-sorting protein